MYLPLELFKNELAFIQKCKIRNLEKNAQKICGCHSWWEFRNLSKICKNWWCAFVKFKAFTVEKSLIGDRKAMLQIGGSLYAAYLTETHLGHL